MPTTCAPLAWLDTLLLTLRSRIFPCVLSHASSSFCLLCRCTRLHVRYRSVHTGGHRRSVQAIKVLNMVKVYGKPIRVNKAAHDKEALDVGANLFVGNLDPDADEKNLFDTFSAFGVIVHTPKIMRDPDSGAPPAALGPVFTRDDSHPAGLALSHVFVRCVVLLIRCSWVSLSLVCPRSAPSAAVPCHTSPRLRAGVSKGFGFVSFDSFEAADAAIEAMHGQFLMNRAISVQYAFKKDSNERHGTPAERVMAENYRRTAAASSRPNTLFASAPSQTPTGGPPVPQPEVGAVPAPPPPVPVAPGPPAAPGPPVPPAAPLGMPPMGGPQGLVMHLPNTAPPVFGLPPWHGGMAMPPTGAAPPPWAMAAQQLGGAPMAAGAPPPPPWMVQRPPVGMPPPQAARPPPCLLYTSPSPRD